METQDFIKLLEDLKNAGFFYNDADFCRKMGIGTSRLSMMKTGKRPVSEKFIHEMRDTFPGFFAPKSVPIRSEELTLDEIHRSLIDHDVRFHETVNRILDAMGVSNKKVANE